jgi:DNA-nicking Smr family endonuclease
MKQLNDIDIANMIKEDFVPDDKVIQKSVRSELHLSTRIPKNNSHTPVHTTIDFHQHTEQEAWQMLIDVIESGVRSVTVITGASGILKPKFQQWAKDSIISPYIISVSPLNNGSFLVKLHKRK